MILEGFSSRTDALFLGARKVGFWGCGRAAGRTQRALRWPTSHPRLLLLPNPSPHPVGLSRALFFCQDLAMHCRCLYASVAEPFDHLVLFCVLVLYLITGTKALDIYRNTYL